MLSKRKSLSRERKDLSRSLGGSLVQHYPIVASGGIAGYYLSKYIDKNTKEVSINYYKGEFRKGENPRQIPERVKISGVEYKVLFREVIKPEYIFKYLIF